MTGGGEESKAPGIEAYREPGKLPASDIGLGSTSLIGYLDILEVEAIVLSGGRLDLLAASVAVLATAPAASPAAAEPTIELEGRG